MREVASIATPTAAAHLLDPLRARILLLAREPMSASQLGEKLNLGRQRVNYHVKLMRDAGLLREAGRRERRNLTEVLYQTAATHYLVDPAAVGELSPDPARINDKASVEHVMALAARTVSEAARADAAAQAQGRKASAAGTETELRFAGAAERDAFLRAAQMALADLARVHGAAPGRGRSHRVVLTAHALPEE